MRAIKFDEIGRDGLAMTDFRNWCLMVQFNVHVNKSSWDSHRCEFKDIEITIESIEWGTPDGDVLESNLNPRNKSRIISAIENHIDQNIEDFGVATSDLDCGWEPTYQNTL